MGVTSGLESSTQAWPSVFNIGNCAIGAGILSFPYAFARSGLLGGSLITVAVALVELYTLNVLMRQATKHRAITYQGLVLSVLGKRASEVMAWTIFLFLFGSCVAFMIIVADYWCNSNERAGDTFGMVLRHFVVEPYNLPQFLAARQIMILLPALTIMLPLSLQRSMGALATASTVSVLVMMLTVVVIAGKAFAAATLGYDGEGAPLLANTALFRIDGHTFSALPIIIFAFHCHIQAVPIYFELVDDPSLLRWGAKRSSAQQPDADAVPAGEGSSLAPESAHAAMHSMLTDGVNVVGRKLRGMYAVLAAAYVECAAMYLLTGICGYTLFPRTAASNILNNFVKSDVLMQGMRFLVGWAVVMHYPINQHAARSALYDLICKYINIEAKQEDVPYPHVAAVTVLFFVASTTTACLVTDLGIVFQLIGGLAGSLLIFILPGGLMVADVRRARQRSSGQISDGVNGVGGLGGHEPLSPPSRGGAAQRQGVRAQVRESLEGYCASQSFGNNTPSHMGAAIEGGFPGDALDAQPCHESRWDRPWVGWLLICVGLAVAVLTMWTSVRQYTHPTATAEMLHAGMSLNTTMVDSAAAAKAH